MSSPQNSVTPANENVSRKGSNGQYSLMWTENKSNKNCSVTSYMISDVVFKHLLGVCETTSENNCPRVHSLSRGRILPVVGDCTVVFILEFYAHIDEMFMLPCTSGGEQMCKKGALRVCGRSFPGLT